PKDLVTQMDREVEIFFATKIKQFYPEHAMLGEDGYSDYLTETRGTIWIIDPIDGTMNFVNQKKHFAIAVGMYYNRSDEIGMVYDVMNNQLYSGLLDGGAYRYDQRLHQLNPQKSLNTSIISSNHHWLMPNRIVEK